MLLNDEEMQVLKDHVNRLGIIDLDQEDWHRIRSQNKLEFCELLSQFFNMGEDLREFYLKRYLSDEEEDPGEEKVNPELSDSTLAIINMSQEQLNELPEATQEKLLQKFELIEQAGREIAMKEIDERTPEEIRVILNAPRDEWDALPRSVTDSIMEKVESLR